MRSESLVVHRRPEIDSAAQNPDATRSSLVRRLHDWNDDSGWQRFFDTYWRLIYAVAVKAGLSDAEAEDVVQETVLAVAKAMRADGYDRTKSSFKTFLYTVTRRRIVDHFRKRTPAKSLVSLEQAAGSGHLPERPSTVDLEEVWTAEWEKNLLEAAIERVRAQVAPKQFQIFDLSVLRQMSVPDVRQLLKVNAAQVYLARHRVGALVKSEVEKLRAAAEAGPPPA